MSRYYATLAMWQTAGRREDNMQWSRCALISRTGRLENGILGFDNNFAASKDNDYSL